MIWKGFILLSVALLLWIVCSNPVTAIVCTCKFEPFLKTDCSDPINNTCIATFACSVQYVFNSNKNLLLTHRDCLSFDDGISTSFCNVSTRTQTSTCCYTDLCNQDITPAYPSDYLDILVTTTITSDVSSNSTMDPSEKMISSRDIIILTVVLFLTAVLAVCIIVLGIFGVHICVQRTRRAQTAPQSDLKLPDLGKQGILHVSSSVDSFDHTNMSCTSGSGSGQPILTQRTIARNITIGEQIGNGRFGQVYIGIYQGDEMAIKKFASRDEKSWAREKEIYNTVLLRHDNILLFFASDIFSNDDTTELWLITQYHPYGSLYDYLNKRTLTPSILMRMAISTCRGLAHLHTEFQGSNSKPAIAHRDIKSRNILVKRNRECCIADFGMAVMKSSNNTMNFPTNPRQGTKRYMAPEILNETINMTNFSSFLSVDIYAFGLVLWEMCKRSGDKNELVGEYEAPFQDLVGLDPTFEEMRMVVIHDRQKPALPSHWNNSDLFRGLSQLMNECWFFNSSARNSAVFYKIKLYKLAKEDKIEYEHDDHE